MVLPKKKSATSQGSCVCVSNACTYGCTMLICPNEPHLHLSSCCASSMHTLVVLAKLSPGSTETSNSRACQVSYNALDIMFRVGTRCKNFLGRSYSRIVSLGFVAPVKRKGCARGHCKQQVKITKYECEAVMV